MWIIVSVASLYVCFAQSLCDAIIKYEKYKLIYDVSEASITELMYKWWGYFCFRKQKHYKSTLLNYLSNIVLYIVGIAEVHCQITKTTRRKAVKYYAVARSS